MNRVTATLPTVRRERDAPFGNASGIRPASDGDRFARQTSTSSAPTGLWVASAARTRVEPPFQAGIENAAVAAQPRERPRTAMPVRGRRSRSRVSRRRSPTASCSRSGDHAGCRRTRTSGPPGGARPSSGSDQTARALRRRKVGFRTSSERPSAGDREARTGRRRLARRAAADRRRAGSPRSHEVSCAASGGALGGGGGRAFRSANDAARTPTARCARIPR